MIRFSLVESAVRRQHPWTTSLAVSLRQFYHTPTFAEATTQGVACITTRRLYSSFTTNASRAGSISAVGSNPLHLFQQECQARGLCDEQGTRLENVDWRIVIASTSAPYSTDGGAVGITGVASQDGHRLSPPNLRTVGICRVTSDGLDFVVKRTSHSAQALLTNPVSMLHSKGQFLVGHSAEQWRFEGSHCTELTWTADEILQLVPKFTLTSFLGSHRLLKQEQQQLEQEQANTATRDKEHNTTAAQVSANRVALGSSKSHLVELIQLARMDLERGDIISLGDELKECVRPLRLLPERVECMLASPDASIMWDRWEWLRRGQKDKNNSDD